MTGSLYRRRTHLRSLIAGAVGFASFLGIPAAVADTWPDRPIKLVIGYSPGGSADFVTRLLAQELTRELGVAVVVANTPGAGGNIANTAVAGSAPDGYTLLVTSAMAVNKALYKGTTYDPDKDFIPVTRLATGTTIVTVRNDLPVKTLAELANYTRARPGTVVNASAGFGSAPHMASALFESVAGVKFNSVQYRGGGPAAVALLGGEADVLFSAPPTVMGFLKEGRVRALAVSKVEPMRAIPGVPGSREAGLPGYEYTFWFGLFVPAGTPDSVVQRLHRAASDVLAQVGVREKIALQGMDATASASPRDFAVEIRAEAPGLERMIRESGAVVQ